MLFTFKAEMLPLHALMAADFVWLFSQTQIIFTFLPPMGIMTNPPSLQAEVFSGQALNKPQRVVQEGQVDNKCVQVCLSKCQRAAAR